MESKHVIFRWLRKIWYRVPLVREPKAWLSRRRIRKRLLIPGLRLVNFGAGTYRLDGWINADISPSAEYYIDARQKLPFPDGTLDAVFSEHFLEHLEYRDAIRWLTECYRCLQPGGIFRVSTPGLRQILEMYAGTSPHVSTEAVTQRHFLRFAPEIEATYGVNCPKHACIVANDKLRLWGGHKFIFDQGLLKTILGQLGFAEIRLVRYGESDVPHMRGLERHAEDEKWMEHAECFILQAIKPPELS